MSAPVGIIRDLLPGSYEASDLAQCLSLVEPRMTVVEGVQWLEGQWRNVGGQKEWTRRSRLVFPENFDGVVKSDVRI